MSIVSGLVETGTEHSLAVEPPRIAEWLVRNAWRVVLGASVLFWIGFAALFVFA